MKKTILLFSCLFLVQFGFGQIIVDTPYGEFVRNSLRVGLGVQRSLYAEIGFARQESYKSKTRCAFGDTPPHGFYTSIEWTAKTQNYNDVFGLKAGYEESIMGLAYALEGKYLTNFDNKDFVITPKIGLGTRYWFVFYGYNISTNSYPFENVGRHQFSIVFNLNKDSFKD